MLITPVIDVRVHLECIIYHVHLSSHCVRVSPDEQTLSPQAKGLFHRAIFQSGVATIGTYTTSHPLGYAKVIFYFNFPSRTYNTM